jgi:hypothetical protein
MTYEKRRQLLDMIESTKLDVECAEDEINANRLGNARHHVGLAIAGLTELLKALREVRE